MRDFPLTSRLAEKLSKIFSAEDQQFAHEWLVTECSPQSLGDFSSQSSFERVRAAALKVSDGSHDRLAWATALGQQDWRDLIMAAGFGNPSDHEAWLDELS